MNVKSFHEFFYVRFFTRFSFCIFDTIRFDSRRESENMNVLEILVENENNGDEKIVHPHFLHQSSIHVGGGDL